MTRAAGADIIECILSRASHDGVLPAFADAHCHLGLMSNGDTRAAHAVQDGLVLLNMGVEPTRYANELARFATPHDGREGTPHDGCEGTPHDGCEGTLHDGCEGTPHDGCEGVGTNTDAGAVYVGLGMHPWWVPASHDATSNASPTSGATLSQAALIDAFDEHFEEAALIGEVGLDFAPRHKDTADAQVALLTHIFERCATRTGLFISLHAVRSSSQVLDLLEASGAHRENTVAFHWFSGDAGERQRALKLGCFFSISERMMETRRGRAHVRALPFERILLETDAPAHEGERCTAQQQAEQLLRTARLAEEIRRSHVEDTR